MKDKWELKIYHSFIEGPTGVFDARSRKAIEEWIYSHVGAAQVVWDEEDHVCRVYMCKHQKM